MQRVTPQNVKLLRKRFMAVQRPNHNKKVGGILQGILKANSWHILLLVESQRATSYTAQNVKLLRKRFMAVQRPNHKKKVGCILQEISKANSWHILLLVESQRATSYTA